MRYTWPGLAMFAGVLAVALHAAGNDDYYGSGVSRWEHATRGGGTALLVALFATASATSLAVLAVGLLRKRLPAGWVLIPGILYCLSLAWAWAGLTVGH